MLSNSFYLMLGLALASPAFGQAAPDQQTGSTDGKGDTVMMRQIGGAAAIGNYEGNKQWSVSIQSNNAQIGNGTDPNGGDGQVYSFGRANIDVGPAGMTFGGDTHVGKNFISRDNNQTILPLLGVEPLNFSTSTSIGFDKGDGLFHRALGHDPYFEYMPMLSAGVQVFTDTCQAMLLVRAGGAVGTEATTYNAPAGVGAAYGAGVSGVCKDLLMFNVDLTRITNGTTAVDQASLMAALKIPSTSWSVGVDLDGRSAKDLSQTNVVYSLPTTPGPTTEMTGKLVVGAVF